MDLSLVEFMALNRFDNIHLRGPRGLGMGDPFVENITRQLNARRDLSNFNTYDEAASRSWCPILNYFGQNLLQTAIKSQNKDAFDVLLPFYDVVNLENKNIQGESALMVAVANTGPDVEISEYFVTELVKSGAFVHTQSESTGETCLHKAIVSPSVNTVQLLLDEGVDVNVRDKAGNTALHTILKCGPGEVRVDEMAALLMFYNADAMVENEERYIPFDYAVKFSQKAELQQVLFNYTFDKHTDRKVNVETVIQLCHSKSPLFSQIFKYKTKVYPSCESNPEIFFTFLDLDSDCLELLVRKRSYSIGRVILWMKWPRPFEFKPPFQTLATLKGIRNLGILLETNLKTFTSFLIQKKIKTDEFIAAVVANNSEEESTQIILFLVSHGMTFGDSAYHTVYEQYGHCNLLKLLLHIGLRRLSDECFKSTMPRFMYDFKYDINSLFKEHSNLMLWRKRVRDDKQYPYGNTIQLLDYFVHPKLADFLWERNDDEQFSGAELRRVRRHPKVPRLVELARNLFRKYLIKTFRITSTSQFYSYVDKLPIGFAHKDILTYEMKIY